MAQYTIKGRASLAVFAVVFTVASQAVMAGGPKDAPLDPKARATLEEVDKFLSEDIDDKRKTCAAGQAPEWVATKRARYGAAVRFADAADMCVGVLQRIGADHRLPLYYRELLPAAGGSSANYAAFPRSVGDAALQGGPKVAIGNGKTAVITPALAFDAGFTVGYDDGASAKLGTAEPQQLKTVAESCLGQQKDAGTCYSVGYMYGAQAAPAGKTSAR